MPLLLALLVVLVGGCAPQTPPATTQPSPSTQAPAATGDTLPADGFDVTWQWESLVTPVETIQPERPELYTLRFDRTGGVRIRADCNSGGGMYTVGAGRRITFGTIALTRAECPPGSLSNRFVRDVSRVSSYFVREGALFLEMPVDSGTLRFRREP